MKKSDILKKIREEIRLPQADIRIIHNEVLKFLVKRLRKEKIFEIPNVGYFTLKTYSNQFIESDKVIGAIFFSETFPAQGSHGDVNFGAVKIPAELGEELGSYFEIGVNKPVISEDIEASREKYRELLRTDIAGAIEYKLERYYNFGQEDFGEEEETPGVEQGGGERRGGLLLQNIQNLDTPADDDDTVKNEPDDGFIFHKTFEEVQGKGTEQQRKNFPFSRVATDFDSGEEPGNRPRRNEGSNPPVLDLQEILKKREMQRESERIEREERERREHDARIEESRGRFTVIEEEEKKDIEEIRKSHISLPEVSVEQIKKARKEKWQTRIWVAVSILITAIISVIVYIKVIGMPEIPEWLRTGAEEKIIIKSTAPVVVIERDYSFPLNYPYPPDKRMVREREGMQGINRDSLVSYSIPLYQVGGFSP
ncbi:MAG: hypothetical protein AB9882_05805 [Ignavibacteriaceae bacterium]